MSRLAFENKSKLSKRVLKISISVIHIYVTQTSSILQFSLPFSQLLSPTISFLPPPFRPLFPLHYIPKLLMKLERQRKDTVEQGARLDGFAWLLPQEAQAITKSVYTAKNLQKHRFNTYSIEEVIILKSLPSLLGLQQFQPYKKKAIF